MLTVLAALMAELLIYVPLVAYYRWTWLNDRLAAAYTAALVLDAAPGGIVAENQSRRILHSIGAQAVAIKMDDQRRLLAITEAPLVIGYDIDMRSVSWFRAVDGAVGDLITSGNGVVRVVGQAPVDAAYIEVILDDAVLHQAVVHFSTAILVLLITISGIGAFLIYLALHYLFAARA
jgi:hypothetical protein